MKTSRNFHLQLLLPLMLALFLGGAGNGLAAVTCTLSPNVVSNTYGGTLALTISGFTNSSETVTVQKFLDADTNGYIDSTDLLVQQFTLKVGTNSVIGGVTNLNVPGDLGTATNAISATLYFQSGDFIQSVVGRFLYKVTSVSGDFSPFTNSLVVTNFLFGQTISGNVYSNGTSQTVPYPVVMMFPPPTSGGHGPGNPMAGVVANSAGFWQIHLPQGAYVPVAFQGNYVANYSTSPVINLATGGSPSTNLQLQIATSTISGSVVDAANSSKSIPGIMFPADNNSGLLASTTTDTNGNFVLKVSAGSWNIGSYDQSLAVHGYVGNNNGLSESAGASGAVVTFAKATALFYGHVKDGSGNPLAGVDIGDYDQNNNLYQADAYTDTNGYYILGAVGGLGSSDAWQVSYSGNPVNYIFATSNVDESNGTNLSAGQAVLANFTGLTATNYITGNVKFQGTNLVGVGVGAYAAIDGLNYNLNSVDTDANGNYSLQVASGDWSVSVNCQGGSDSLSTLLNGQNYECPENENTNLLNNNGVVNFTIQNCAGVQIFTTMLPSGQEGNYYDNFLNGSTCNGNQIWSLLDPGDLSPSGLSFNSNGEIFGTPSAGGTYNFTVELSDGNGNSTTQPVSLVIGSPLTINTSQPIPDGTNGIAYSYTLRATGGTPPYTWTIASFSQPLPPNLSLATDGVISGTPSATVNYYYYFSVLVSDATSTTNEWDAFMVIDSPPLPPLVFTNTTLPNGVVGAPYSAQLGASGGESPYSWALAAGSLYPPSGLTLNSNGTITGTPTNSTAGSFKVQLSDMASDVTNKVFSITINPRPVLSAINWQANQLRMLLTGAKNQNYTLQSSTNLISATWSSLFVTNNAATNSFIILDGNATNAARFYRILVGP